jgi:peptidoglycan hydrolase-like protein with peptidoglycan-binding domain
MPFSRRSLLFIAAAAVGPIVGVGALSADAVASSGSATSQAAALPSLNMEAVMKAAQWDPVKVDEALTPGAGPSVKLVETALNKEGLLGASYVDGHFGTRTVTAYAAWQRRLGYSGIAASGLPGKTSLTELGAGRYTVTKVITVGARTTLQGFPVNTRTAAMFRAAQTLSGLNFVVEQGSYSPGTDPSSAGTHDGGGVLDLDAEDLTASQRTKAVTALRKVGFAAWLRTPSQGDWPLHIHAVAISDTDLSTQAQEQVGAYYEGRNGLANNAVDDGPSVTKVTYEEYLLSR